MNKPIIKLNNIGKKYTLNGKDHWVLRNVDLQVYPGEKIGIMGNNGAGKTTLLKIISGIVVPTTGSVVINTTKIISMIDLLAGFDPELTGRENILLNGLLAGISKSEILKNYQQIIDFSEIGPYIDQPFFTFSSGMKFRLAFSIAISSKPELLVLDEIFHSADVNFQYKVFHDSILATINRLPLTMVISSHNARTIQKLTQRQYLVENTSIHLLNNKQIDKMIDNRIKMYKDLRNI